MWYAGIGSRKTPIHILVKMTKIGEILAKKNCILRSGGASGADSAFEKGCDIQNGKKEIYLPWKNFNNNSSKLYYISDKAKQIAKEFHPTWNKLNNSAKLLHSRNVYQILGLSLNEPVSFVICYSPGTGGTEQALRIAKYYQIPIFNMFNNSWYDSFYSYISNYLALRRL